MLHPSYSELIKVVNSDVDELYKGEIKILPEQDEEESEEG